MAARIAVDIDEAVRATIDKLRKERGVSMKEIVNDAMRRALREIEKKQQKAAPHA